MKVENHLIHSPMEIQTRYGNYQEELPSVPITQLEEKLRDISPLFLGETPYAPTESLPMKCLKSVLAALSLLSYLGSSETRNLVRFRSFAKEVNEIIANSSITQEINELKEEVNQKNQEIDNAQKKLDNTYTLQEGVEFEADFCRIGELFKNPKEELISRVNDTFKYYIKGRDNFYFNNRLYNLNDREDRDALFQARRSHYERKYFTLERTFGSNSEEQLFLLGQEKDLVARAYRESMDQYQESLNENRASISRMQSRIDYLS